MEFELALGVRKTDVLLKYMLDYALEESAAEIQAILTQYSVPLVQCSRCIVGGDLPAHGSYTAPLEASAATPPSAAPDQVVTRDRVEQWLASGSSVQEELANALLAVDPERITYVIEMGADVNAQDLQGYASLHSAARLKRPDIIKLLIDKKADINGLDRDGWTPLMHAAYRNHLPSLELLVARGANIETESPQGFTALAITVEEGRFEAAKKLIELGAKVNAPMGKDKFTPVMIAASQPVPSEAVPNAEGRRVLSSLDVARALIAHKADVNARSSEGVTALMIAAARNNVPMLGLLAKAGADLSLRANNGKHALAVAEDNGSDTAAKMIKLLMVSKTSPTAEARDPASAVERK
jgi:ankyrin repeat protein